MSDEYGDNIICPYCQYEFSDSWDFNLESDTESEIECGNPECEKEFAVIMDVSVSYSTHKKEKSK